MDEEREAALRAAFLYRLAFFVQWPESELAERQALRFCVVGGPDSLVGKLLSAQAGTREVQNHPVEVHSLTAEQGLAGCHIAYAEAELVVAPPPGTLLVVDSPQRLSAQGALALVRQAQPGGEIRLGFVGRQDRLQGSRFQLSAKLLQLVKFENGTRS
ncbi:YfiR family protein [Pseudomarimonas arenosa]|uniref:YfiR family protein n=1 Tax=Pseudomarimonas arenosa TaxID=2774145 RepID=A0AAW3ZML8_9GAMM|nr:YfiR family protein [Pseudomarimonas arenosa]